MPRERTPTRRPSSTTGTRSKSFSSRNANASWSADDDSIVAFGGSAMSPRRVAFGSSPAATTCPTSVLRVTTPASRSPSVTNTARTSGRASASPATRALAPASSDSGSGTIASRTSSSISLRVDATGLQRGRHLADRGDERGVAQRDAAIQRDVPDAVERVGHLVGEPAADLVAVPEEAAEVLHPFEVRDGDAARVREDVGQHQDAALGEDPVPVDRRRPVRALCDELAPEAPRVRTRDLVLTRGHHED